jgi:hypothetical protein
MRTIAHIIILHLLTSFSLINTSADKPRLSQLKISECIDNCNDPDKIISDNYADSVYTINFGVLLNCRGQDTLSVKLKNDTLKLRVLPKRKSQYPIIENNGDTTWVTPISKCDCYYKFSAEIKKMPSRPKVVMVNKEILTKL